LFFDSVVIHKNKGGYILIEKQKKYFGKEVFKFIKTNILIFAISIPLGLCFGLCPFFASNTLKHIFWGVFGYTVSFLLLIVLLHELKIKNIIYKTIYFSFGISIVFDFIYELNSININIVISQLDEIFINTIGSIIIFLINLKMYNKSLKSGGQNTN